MFIVSSINNFRISVQAFFEGLFYVVKHRWVWSYVFLAIVINVIIFIGLLGLLFLVSDSFIDFFVYRLGDNFLVVGLDLALSIVLWLFLAFILLLLFNIISAIVNSPVYSLLTAKIIEKEIPGVNFPESSIFTELFVATAFEFKKLVLTLLFVVLTFGLNFVPFVGSITFLIINFLQIVLIFGLDIFEPYHSLKGFKFRTRLFQIFRHFDLYGPFLVICGFLATLPIVNIILNPISIVAASVIAKKKLIKNL